MRRSGIPDAGLETVTITQASNVIGHHADHIELNGIDRWLGGVQLLGEKSEWRWDRTSTRLVPG